MRKRPFGVEAACDAGPGLIATRFPKPSYPAKEGV